MRRNWAIALLIAISFLGSQTHAFVLAQEPQPLQSTPLTLTIFTSYPSQVTQLGETVTHASHDGAVPVDRAS